MHRSHKILLALLTGLLVCCSFPTMVAGVRFPELGWLAWIALVPLLLAVRDSSPRGAFLLAFLSAFIFYGGSLFWLYRAIHGFGGIAVGIAVAVMCLLFVILAAFAGLALYVARLMETRWRGEFLIWVPVAWTAAEFARNVLPFGGFPWSNVAMALGQQLPFVQIADIVGVFGVIFLVVWVNAFLAEGVARLRGETVRLLLPKAVLTVLLVGAVVGYGLWRTGTVDRQIAAAPSLRVALVQSNISQEEKWRADRAQANLDRYRRATAELADAADLIVWPEAAFPWPMPTEAVSVEPLLLGLDEGGGETPFVLLGAITERPDGDDHNSAVLFDAGGRVRGLYHKEHLVPFGEYVPMQQVLFFARKLTEPVGRFLPGHDQAPLAVGAARLGVLVCYEDIFPEIARRQARAGATLFVNITNDAWYGRSSAPYQHAALSAMRAIEERRFLVRATQTGLTAVIDPVGRLLMTAPLFEEALLVSKAGLLEELSPYARSGDWFAWACVAYIIIGIVFVVVRRGRSSQR